MKFGLYAWEPDGSVDRKLKVAADEAARHAARASCVGVRLLTQLVVTGHEPHLFSDVAWKIRAK